MKLVIAVLLALTVAEVVGAQPASERFIGAVQWIAGAALSSEPIHDASSYFPHQP